MTPRERAENILIGIGYKLGPDTRDGIINWIEQELEKQRLDNICEYVEAAQRDRIADRQALQSELEKRFTDPLDEYPTKGSRKWAIINITRVIEIIQSVFAQQSQPEEGKPHAFQGRSDRWCEICNQPDRAEIHKVLVDVAFQQSVIETECNRRILADRQALQSELEKRLGWLRKQDCEKYIAYEEMIDVIQSVFAQQSKPFSVFRPAATYFISKAECMRRISADRQALQSELEGLIEQYKSCFLPFTIERIIIIKCLEKIQSVFAQQSQPEEGKPNLTPFDSSCSTCVREAKEEAEEDAKRVERMISSADRIATLHEWQARDALTIQKLNESNNLLSEKIAQLEKEKNELTQKIPCLEFDQWREDDPRFCSNSSCIRCRSRSANRKA